MDEDGIRRMLERLGQAVSSGDLKSARSNVTKDPYGP